MEDEENKYNPVLGVDGEIHHFNLQKHETACGIKKSEKQPKDIYDEFRFSCNGECLKYSY